MHISRVLSTCLIELLLTFRRRQGPSGEEHLIMMIIMIININDKNDNNKNRIEKPDNIKCSYHLDPGDDERLVTIQLGTLTTLD